MESTLASATICVFGAVLLIAMISVASSIRIVRADTRLSVYRLGRYIGDKGPGLVVLMPGIDRGVVKQVGEVESTSSRGLIGMMGETRTNIYPDGKVVVAGKEWDAMSQQPISAGQRVRVVRMILEVEKE